MAQREPSQRLRGVVHGPQRAHERVERCIEGRAVAVAGEVTRERERRLGLSVSVRRGAVLRGLVEPEP